jgi:hypothetical protein
MFILLSYETHRVYIKTNLKSVERLENQRIPREAKDQEPSIVSTTGTIETTDTDITNSSDHRSLRKCANRLVFIEDARLLYFSLIHQRRLQKRGFPKVNKIKTPDVPTCIYIYKQEDTVK